MAVGSRVRREALDTQSIDGIEMFGIGGEYGHTGG